jgi:predicted dehydrogenase
MLLAPPSVAQTNPVKGNFTVKIAIVGCGKIADAHVEEIRKVGSAQLVAVSDLEPLMAEQLAARFGIPRWYSDLSEMLAAEQIDVIHITTPPQSHVALVRQCFNAGCHVFLEKPVALRHSDTQAIVQAAANSNCKLAVNYWPNFERQALDLRAMYQAGVLGAPVHIESFYGYNLSGEYGMAIRRDPHHWVRSMPGMLFQNVLDHVLNKIVPYLDDSDPEMHVDAYCRAADDDMSGADQLLDELRVMIRGGKVSAYATFSAHARPVGHTMRFYGTRNTAYADFNARTLVLERKQQFPSALGRLAPAFQVSSDYFRQSIKNVRLFSRSRFHFFDGMRRLLTEFYSSIENNSPPPIAYEEILRVSSLIDTIVAEVYPAVLA